jgi:rhamnose utilization protein RhaD (predicted bifunctional aldolase and dehydrogenase)
VTLFVVNVYGLDTSLPLQERWCEGTATQSSADERRLHRLNVLGPKKSLTAFGESNTSAKLLETGTKTTVQYFKRLRGYVATMKLDEFVAFQFTQSRKFAGARRAVADMGTSSMRDQFTVPVWVKYRKGIRQFAPAVANLYAGLANRH